LGANSISDYEKRTFVEAAMNLKDYYDVVIYVSPRGVEMEDNGIRTTDLSYRIKIDTAIQMALEEFKPKHLIKVEGTTEERIATILQNI
jgi:nicotinamide riboside kinase